jgi:hypothetical protein
VNYTNNMKKILLLILLFSYVSVRATPTDSLTTNLFVYSLEEQWLVYDKTLKSYLPYFSTIYGNVNKLHVDISKPAYKSLYLNMLGDSLATIFINNKLSYIFTKRQWVNFSIDSLQNYTRENILLLTYFKENNFEKLPETYISVKPRLQLQKTTITQTNYITQQYQNSFRKNSLGVIGLFVLIITAIICSVHTPLFKWSLLWKNLTNFIQARTQIKRLQGLQFFWYTIFYSLTLAFVVTVLSNNITNIETQKINLSNLSSISGNIYSFGVLFLLLVLTVLSKYVLIAVMGNLYFNRQSLNLHFQEYITISQIICTLILLIALMVASLPITFVNSLSFLKYTTLFLLALQAILISYRLRQSMSYATIYFFAYLFSTEFVPFLLYANFFISL